jgi:molybdopterin synthase sulfur carrier subunit
MELRIKAFGIAKEIFGSSNLDFHLQDGKNIKALKKELIKSYSEFDKLASFSVAVNQEYQEDDFVIKEGDEIVIIPPVSGG